MTTTYLTPPEQRIELTGISWNTYEALLQELSDRRLRLTYYKGYLEIMTPSPEHENYKRVVGRFAETLAEELSVNIYPLGSTTFKRPQLTGAEPDECFYINNIDLVRGKKRLDLNYDPAPDLVIEIDITSSSIDRLQVYAALGVTEVWIYNGKEFNIYQLNQDRYLESDRSIFFPDIPLLEITQFLQRVETTDYLQLVREFRDWVRIQIQ